MILTDDMFKVDMEPEGGLDLLRELKWCDGACGCLANHVSSMLNAHRCVLISNRELASLSSVEGPTALRGSVYTESVTPDLHSTHRSTVVTDNRPSRMKKGACALTLADTRFILCDLRMMSRFPFFPSCCRAVSAHPFANETRGISCGRVLWWDARDLSSSQVTSSLVSVQYSNTQLFFYSAAVTDFLY